MVEDVEVGAVVEDVKPTDVVVLAGPATLDVVVLPGTATLDVVAGEAVVVTSEVSTAQAVVMTTRRSRITQRLAVTRGGYRPASTLP